MTASWSIPGTAWWWANWACNPPALHTAWLHAFTYQHHCATTTKETK